jgi:peptidoglycan/LPS O-acetylase OafA/YrhL
MYHSFAEYGMRLACERLAVRFFGPSILISALLLFAMGASTIVVAALSYAYFERPILGLRRRYNPSLQLHEANNGAPEGALPR